LGILIDEGAGSGLMRVFDRNLLKILGCPRCKQKLELWNEELSCDFCKTKYPIIKGVPVLHVKKNLYDERYYENGGVVPGKSKRSRPVNFLRVMVKKATPTCRLISKSSKKIILSHLKDNPPSNLQRIILNIGPAKTKDMKKLLRECGRVLKLCVDLQENADIVGDVRYLPFQENSIDFLFVIAVLEHVDDPAKAVKDIYRSLKPGGKVYAEIPFCRAYHAVPCDFQRYTLSGIEKLFENFRCIEKGVASGPGSAMSLSISSFFAILFSLNNITWYKFWNRIFRIITKPIQYIDVVCKDNKLAHRFACALYILCEKGS
jgi:uncharacterized protein YbaR (Trm112 family)/SAM-dependent methyltransferase